MGVLLFNGITQTSVAPRFLAPLGASMDAVVRRLGGVNLRRFAEVIDNLHMFIVIHIRAVLALHHSPRAGKASLPRVISVRVTQSTKDVVLMFG